MENTHPLLKKFIADVQKIVHEEQDELTITSKVEECMKEIIKHKDIIPESHKQPKPDKYAWNAVYVAPDNSFSIVSVVWAPGQTTPIHDHCTWGVVGVLQGAEHEVSYKQSPSKGQPLIKVEDHVLNEGGTMVCCTSDQDIHQVDCASEVPCVGIHVYGANVGEIKRHVYDLGTGRTETIVTPWDLEPVV